MAVARLGSPRAAVWLPGVTALPVPSAPPTVASLRVAVAAAGALAALLVAAALMGASTVSLVVVVRAVRREGPWRRPLLLPAGATTAPMASSVAASAASGAPL